MKRFLSPPRAVPVRGQSRWAPLSRRTVLRGLLRGAAVSIALPPLECFFNGNGSAYACGGAIPRRFGLFFWGNGNLPERWVPEGEGASWTLSEQLAPLADVQQHVTVVSGMSVKLPNNLPHTSGVAGVLTAATPVAVGSDYTLGGPSLDQVIAAEIGGTTLYRSIQTAATNIVGQSWNGPSSQNPAETSPIALFERLFGASFREPGEETEPDPTLALRRSVLDATLEDAGALRKRLGKADQARLDQHLDGIRELEQRLAQLEADPPNLEACSQPTAPKSDYPDADGRPQISARSRAMVDLLAMAFACDQTRVFGHYLHEPVDNVLYPGASNGHHNLTHDEPAPQDEVNAITIQCVDEFAYLVRRFAGIDEGGESLLDNCAILGCSEVSEGRTHSLDDMPLLIAGRACGSLTPGLHYRSLGQESVTMVHLSLLRAMEIPAAEFGEDEAWVDSSLSDIEA